jgi:hypothetical protein
MYMTDINWKISEPPHHMKKYRVHDDGKKLYVSRLYLPLSEGSLRGGNRTVEGTRFAMVTIRAGPNHLSNLQILSRISRFYHMLEPDELSSDEKQELVDGLPQSTVPMEYMLSMASKRRKVYCEKLVAIGLVKFNGLREIGYGEYQVLISK